MNREHVAVQMLLRSWPFPRGAGWIIDRLFSQTRFGEQTATVQTTDGFSLKVMPNDHIGRHIYLTGEFDRSTVEVLCDFAEPNDVLMDIGANIGYVSACFLTNISGSSVIAVEPQPVIRELLAENLRPFDRNRYAIFEVAMSDRDHDVWFEICPHNLGGSKIVAGANNQTINVEAWSAERIFAAINRVDIVKLDVEGHEATIIQAAEKPIMNLRPKVIYYEDQTASSAPDGAIGSLFRRMGYRVFAVRKRLTALDYVIVDSRSDCISNDYLAVDVSRDSALAKACRFRRPG
jgi:FkbM family methyltransferase